MIVAHQPSPAVPRSARPSVETHSSPLLRKSRPDYLRLLTTRPQPRAFLSSLCFHNLTNCFSRKPVVLITIRIDRRWFTLCALGAPISVNSVLRFSPFCSSRVFNNLRTLFLSCALSFTRDPLFSIACALFRQNTRGGGGVALHLFGINNIHTLPRIELQTPRPHYSLPTTHYPLPTIHFSFIRPPASWKPVRGYQCG